MGKSIIAKLMIVLLVALSASTGLCADTRDAEVLGSAETLFKMMKARDYRGVWDNLTVKSKERIVNECHKAVARYETTAKLDVVTSKEAVEADFRSGGPISKAYWDAYLENFDPDTVLEQSQWTMGKVNETQAEVVLQYRKAERPTYLKLHREEGKWKVGLIETFGSSKR